ncbi:tubulin-binding prefolding complex subunit [Saccharomycopsis crataegensis]|uniref:Tubulin-binding prefolding complex subunit n=1 Tax=Saccharomycopsis crataegensis TaxID=43959 RepID=A0AAV5QUW9_9ASCO|nr:tubulin-binding prefolding complex subunit [Saccharomycopsis crataegensis]
MEQLEKLSVDFTKFQNDLNELMKARQKLETQYQENKIVLDELTQIKTDKESNKIVEYPKIFKQTGSILLPIDFQESETNVTKRIEFITGEITRVEAKVKETNGKLEKTRDELIKLRSTATA